MKQAIFEQAHASDWDALEKMLTALESGKRSEARQQLPRFAEHYRRLVRQHALAVDRQYSMGLINRLQSLLQRSHDQLYRRRDRMLRHIVRFVAFGFPSAVREHARFFWIATLLFYMPAVMMGVWSFHDSEAIHSVMSPESVSRLEFMYDPGNTLVGRDADRQASTDFEMLGFYVWNNTSIGFRAFASGMLFGAGTVFITSYNGVVIGSAAGHLSGLGYTETFWPFVSGHAAFELTAIGVSAGAGLMLGAALLMPGRRTRVDALRHAAGQAVPLITGAAMMFFAAALVEAFWSPSDMPATTKYIVGVGLWIFVILYFTLSGRRRRAT